MHQRKSKSSNTDQNVLTVEDLSIGYSAIPIIQSVDFSLAKGTLMAIIGINGIGKSTLLRTLGNIQPKLSGGIMIDGKAMEAHSSLQLASKISLVLTEAIASKNMTVLELIALGRQPYTNWIGTLTQTDMDQIKHALNSLEITDLQHKKCYQLSDGQLQRVMIARALAQDTQIILLDEPTTHLDLYHKVQILKLLRSIAHETQKTVVFTTHEIELTLQLCDKMLLLDGKKSMFGSPDELIKMKAFDTLFPSDTVIFDAASQSFRIQQ